jgi:hypothetical protein
LATGLCRVYLGKNLEKLEKAEIDLLLDIADSEGRAESFDFNKEIIF